LTPEYTCQVGNFAKENHLRLHLDGARIFNASCALGIPPAKLAEPADSVTFCLSKGLCAPVGSVICGRKDFIARARRIRKQLGGGMRQAGVLAAAGIVALEQMTERLGEDHEHARRLAEGLANHPKLTLPFGMPETNMVFVNLNDFVQQGSGEIATALKREGILVGVIGPRNFRLVTHYWVTAGDIKRVISAFQKI